MHSFRALRFLCISMTLAVGATLPVSAQTARPDRPTRYVEFLARPTSCLVGHSFVQIGTMTRDGAMRADVTLGLYPAHYPHMDVDALINAPGRIARTSADTRARATARYQLAVSEATYRKALSHGRHMAAKWRRYDLTTENCNAVLFEFADRLGLNVRRDMMDLPANIVSHMQMINGGRSRASWRPTR